MTDTVETTAPAPAKIRQAVAADCESVATMLNAEFASTVSLDAFRRLFDFAWSPEGYGPGLVVEAEGRVVGYLGTIYSQRTDASGRSYTVCSLSSWYVQPAYRSMGLALLLKTINQRGVSVISLSPNQNAAPVYLKCGMKEISAGFHLYPPWLGLPALPFGSARARLVTGARDVRAVLPAFEQRILDDHAPYPCAHYALVHNDSVAYLVTKRRIRAGFPRVPITEVLYCSDSPLVRREFARIVRAICRRELAAGVVFDRALLGDDVPPGGRFRERLRVGRGGEIALAARDTLYSEMVLLD